MEHSHLGPATSGEDAVANSDGGAPAIPDIINNKDRLAAQQLVGRELKEDRRIERDADAGVELDSGHDDVANAQLLADQTGGDHTAPRNHEHRIVVISQAVNDRLDIPLDVVPAEDPLQRLDPHLLDLCHVLPHSRIHQMSDISLNATRSTTQGATARDAAASRWPSML